MAEPMNVCAFPRGRSPASPTAIPDSHPGGPAMTAFRFARVALPSLALPLALSFASLALPGGAAAAPEDAEAFPRDADVDGPATRRLDERRRANDADWFRAPAGHGPHDFPSAQVHDAVVANANAATARAIYRRAESAMHAAFRAARREFDESAELKEALAAEQRAYDALQEARREGLQEVLDNPKYRAMLDLREALSQRIADRREATGDTIVRVVRDARLVSTGAVVPPPREDDTVAAIATVKLRVGSDASAMEREALAENDKVRQARSELVAASAKVGALRERFDKSLREDADFKAARDELEDARIARVAAETYLRGADLAAGEALDFAYHVRRYDYYRYNNRDYGYGYSPYRFNYPYYGASFLRR